MKLRMVQSSADLQGRLLDISALPDLPIAELTCDLFREPQGAQGLHIAQ